MSVDKICMFLYILCMTLHVLSPLSSASALPGLTELVLLWAWAWVSAAPPGQWRPVTNQRNGEQANTNYDKWPKDERQDSTLWGGDQNLTRGVIYDWWSVVVCIYHIGSGFWNSHHNADIDCSSSGFPLSIKCCEKKYWLRFLIWSDGERRRILKGLISFLQKTSSVLIFYSTQIGCLKLSANC